LQTAAAALAAAAAAAPAAAAEVRECGTLHCGFNRHLAVAFVMMATLVATAKACRTLVLTRLLLFSLLAGTLFIAGSSSSSNRGQVMQHVATYI
jgi:hypothetical protein